MILSIFTLSQTLYTTSIFITALMLTLKSISNYRPLIRSSDVKSYAVWNKWNKLPLGWHNLIYSQSKSICLENFLELAIIFVIRVQPSSFLYLSFAWKVPLPFFTPTISFVSLPGRGVIFTLHLHFCLFGFAFFSFHIFILRREKRS